MLCIKCKKDIPEGAVWCPWCGKKQQTAKRKVHRRARGTGSIKRDDRYAHPYIAIAPGTGAGTGRRYIGCFDTVREAQQALELYCSERLSDLHNATVAEIYDLWSDKHFDDLSDSGVQGYRAAYKSIAQLHGCRMRELKTADFQRCIDAFPAASRSKLEKIRQLCSQLCKYAMQNDVIGKNYAQFVKLPRAEKKEKAVFTEDDLKVLWQHTDDKRVQIILVLIYTGFRIGELTALRPSDIHDGYMVGGEKTEAGRDRIVPFPSSVPEIEQFVRSWLAERPDSSETVLGISDEYLRKYMFYPCLAELGLIAPPVKSKSGKDLYKTPRLTPHCARHTFASLCAEAGMSPENLQKIIGHASYETTADIYIHKNIKVLIRDMSKLTK